MHQANAVMPALHCRDVGRALRSFKMLAAQTNISAPRADAMYNACSTERTTCLVYRINAMCSNIPAAVLDWKTANTGGYLSYKLSSTAASEEKLA